MKKLIFLLSILAFGSCTKNSVTEEVNPVALEFKLLTSRDSKGVAAKINNKVWYSSTASGRDFYAVRGGINPNELTLIASGNFSSQTAQSVDRITIFVSSVTALGTYNLGGNTANNGIYTVLDSEGNLINYTTDATRKGTIQITTYDLQNKLISGFFTFQAVSATGEIEIKEGEFQNVPFAQ